MEQTLKQRLVGAIVLVALGVIFIPSFFNGGRPQESNILKEIPPVPIIKTLEIKPAIRPAGLPPEKPIDEMYALELKENKPEEKLEVTKTTTSGLNTKGIPRAWVIQVGSFSKEVTAENLNKKLQKQGYQAFVRSAKKEGKKLYRVFVGPKIDREQVLMLKKEIDKKYNLKSLVLEFKA